jgi:hypothetical protein
MLNIRIDLIDLSLQRQATLDLTEVAHYTDRVDQAQFVSE